MFNANTVFRDHLQLILKNEYVVYNKCTFWFVKKCEHFHLLISFLEQVFYQQIETIMSFDSKFFWKGKKLSSFSLFSIEAARKWKEVSVSSRNLSLHFIFWDIFVLLLKHFFHLLWHFFIFWDIFFIFCDTFYIFCDTFSSFETLFLLFFIFWDTFSFIFHLLRHFFIFCDTFCIFWGTFSFIFHLLRHLFIFWDTFSSFETLFYLQRHFFSSSEILFSYEPLSSSSETLFSSQTPFSFSETLFFFFWDTFGLLTSLLITVCLSIWHQEEENSFFWSR